MTLPEAKTYTGWVLSILGGSMLVVWLFMQLLDLTPINRDDTDRPWPHLRSGLKVLTDDLTGCQYLENGRGGMTPRLDGAGSHFGCAQ